MPEMIKVCPNCGHILVAAEIVRTPQRTAGGKFLCSECDYEGLPILVAASQYDRSKFKKKICNIQQIRFISPMQKQGS